jgi:hypothetical protein
MKVANNTEEAFTYGMVTSLLDTLRMMVMALATTSTYTVMVGSMWGRYTLKMEREEKEAQRT